MTAGEFASFRVKAYQYNLSKTASLNQLQFEEDYGYFDAINLAFCDLYYKAIAELDIRPVALPDVDVIWAGADGLKMTAEVTTELENPQLYNMISIKNMRDEKPKDEFDIRVDRSTIFGNPIRMANETERNFSCDEYAKYFLTESTNNPAFKAELDKLVELFAIHGKLNLFCWCAPNRCHGETIRAYICENMGRGLHDSDK